MVRCLPSSTAEAPVNVIVPKLSKGSSNRRPAAGDSSTHSAEEREDAYVTLFWYDCPVLASRMRICHVPSDCWLIETLTLSPALTVSGTVSYACCSASPQTVYITY